MNFADSFRKLRLQHTILLVLLLIAFTGSVIYAVNITISPNTELERMGSVVALICSIACLLTGFNIFKRKITAARNHDNPPTRVTMYMNACLIWWTMNCVPALLSLLLFLFTAYYSFIALAVLHGLILLVFMPRKDNIAVLLRLTDKDIQA